MPSHAPLRADVAERPRRRVRVAGLVFGVLAALGVLEAGLRGFVRTGPDGEQSLFGNRLVPNAAPPLYRETTTTGSRNEVHRVTEQVVRAFVRAAEEAGAEAVVAVLPSATHLVDVECGNPWWDGALRRAVEGTGAVVADPTAALLDAAVSRRLPYDRMFTRGGAGHATAEGNALIAERLRPAVSDAVGRARSRR